MTLQVSQVDDKTTLLTFSGETNAVCNDHFEPDYLQQEKLVTRTAQGRGIVYFFTLATNKLVLRHYKRGGFVGKVINDKFIFTGIDNTRCHQELTVLQHLREAGVNVPAPIAGRVEKKGIFYRADIITQAIDNCNELHEILHESVVSDEIWQAIGVEIRKMHNAQVYHGDINVKNVLLNMQTGIAKVHLLDFDKCRIKSGDEWKELNLVRFKRSLTKQSSKFANYNYEQRNWDSLESAYQNYK